MGCWCFLLSVFCLNQKCHMVKGNLSLAVIYWVSRYVCLCSCFSSLYNGWYMPICTPSLRESSPSRHNIFRGLTSRHWFWSSSRTSTLRWQSQPTRKFTNQPLHFRKTKETSNHCTNWGWHRKWHPKIGWHLSLVNHNNLGKWSEDPSGSFLITLALAVDVGHLDLLQPKNNKTADFC